MTKELEEHLRKAATKVYRDLEDRLVNAAFDNRAFTNAIASGNPNNNLSLTELVLSVARGLFDADVVIEPNLPPGKIVYVLDNTMIPGWEDLVAIAKARDEPPRKEKTIIFSSEEHCLAAIGLVLARKDDNNGEQGQTVS